MSLAQLVIVFALHALRVACFDLGLALRNRSCGTLLVKRLRQFLVLLRLLTRVNVRGRVVFDFVSRDVFAALLARYGGFTRIRLGVLLG